MLDEFDFNVYSLLFGTNFFEGFVYLSAPDTTSPMAATVNPVSVGPLLGFTGCTGVNPASSDNLIAFRVLTSTYVIEHVTFQQWGFLNPDGQTVTLLPGVQVPFPGTSSNCPPSEVVQ